MSSEGTTVQFLESLVTFSYYLNLLCTSHTSPVCLSHSSACFQAAGLSLQPARECHHQMLLYLPTSAFSLFSASSTGYSMPGPLLGNENRKFIRWVCSCLFKAYSLAETGKQTSLFPARRLSKR